MEGFNTTERFIEVPWCLNRHGGAQRVLDVGYAHADVQYLEKLASLNIPELHGIDLAPVKHITITDPSGVTRPLLTPVQADIRHTPYESDFFDLILCISTIEHVGLDNEGYQSSRSPFTPQGDVDALREMFRITKPRGRLLMTMPFGKFQYFGWFVQYDMDRLVRLLAATDYHVNEMHFFRYRNGWHECYAHELKDVTYQSNGAPGAAGLVCVELEKVKFVWGPGQ